MITKDPKEIEILRQGGKILATILNLLAGKVNPGVSAAELNDIAEREIEKAGAISSFKNYKADPSDPTPFPAALCVSVNDEVVHGVPTKKKILKEGDIVGLDLGIWYKGLCTDAAITVAVGKVSEEKQLLMKTARESLEGALSIVQAGVTTGDIGHAIESLVKEAGFEVVRELVGHGVGAAVHEDPELPCFGKSGTGYKLPEGLVCAVEPMVNGGHWKVHIGKDNWTIITEDGSPSAHFEHTILVTKNGCEILTKV